VAVDWDGLKLAHGQLVHLELDEHKLAFRQLTPDEAEALYDKLERAPELALQIALDACALCCVAGAEHLEEVTDSYPLAFSSESGVCEMLLKLANDALAASIKKAIRNWRAADRQLGQVAQNLLAFKAYTGGVASPEALAGALHWAEHLDTTKGLYKLHLSFMRALAKRKG
jgi:hypothetical protein